MTTAEATLANSMGVEYKIDQVQIGKYKINYLVAGQGAPILLVHGGNMGWGMWYKTIPELSKYFKVYAIDLVGSGGSTKIDFRSSNLEVDYVTTLENFILINNINRISLVGHSFGGWIILRLLLRKRILINRVVLVNSVGLTNHISPAQWPASIYIIAKLLSYYVMDVSKRGLQIFLSSIFYDKKIIDTLFLDYLCESLNRTKISYPLLFINSMLRPFRFKKNIFINENLIKINEEVMIMWGLRDKMVPLRYCKKSLKIIRNIKTVWFDKSGHLPPLEEAEKFNFEVLNFLK